MLNSSPSPSNLVLGRLAELPLIGILRGFDAEALPSLVSAAARGGFKLLEITMNTPGAAEQIRHAIETAGDELSIGAGTVTSRKLLDEALKAGASFIVTPTVQREVILECASRNIPVFPGAFSPSEACLAWELGAAMVKVFPAEFGGPAFIRALKAPFPSIKLLPTGGVDLRTLPHFLAAGADGAGIGSPLFPRDRVESLDWPWIEAQCQAFATVWEDRRKSLENSMTTPAGYR